MSLRADPFSYRPPPHSSLKPRCSSIRFQTTLLPQTSDNLHYNTSPPTNATSAPTLLQCWPSQKHHYTTNTPARFSTTPASRFLTKLYEGSLLLFLPLINKNSAHSAFLSLSRTAPNSNNSIPPSLPNSKTAYRSNPGTLPYFKTLPFTALPLFRLQRTSCSDKKISFYSTTFYSTYTISFTALFFPGTKSLHTCIDHIMVLFQIIAFILPVPNQVCFLKRHLYLSKHYPNPLQCLFIMFYYFIS